jgi:type II secretory pathway component PulC
MKVYQSKNAANAASIAFTLSAIIAIVITLVYFRPYWYFLIIFISPVLLLSLIIPETNSSYYSIKDGYLIKQFRNYNHNPWKTYKLDENGRRDHNETIFSIKLSEIVRIERRKNLLSDQFVAIYYSENDAIDIYLKPKEMDAFLKDISEKRDPSVNGSLRIKPQFCLIDIVF